MTEVNWDLLFQQFPGLQSAVAGAGGAPPSAGGGNGEWNMTPNVPTWRGQQYWGQRAGQYTANRPIDVNPPQYQIQTPGQMQYPIMQNSQQVQFPRPQVDPSIANAWQSQGRPPQRSLPATPQPSSDLQPSFLTPSPPTQVSGQPAPGGGAPVDFARPEGYTGNYNFTTKQWDNNAQIAANQATNAAQLRALEMSTLTPDQQAAQQANAANPYTQPGSGLPGFSPQAGPYNLAMQQAQQGFGYDVPQDQMAAQQQALDEMRRRRAQELMQMQGGGTGASLGGINYAYDWEQGG